MLRVNKDQAKYSGARERMRLARESLRFFEDSGLVYDRHPYPSGPGRDVDLLRIPIMPASELEEKAMQEEPLPDVELELLRHKLTAVVEEAREVYSGLSISEGVITGHELFNLHRSGRSRGSGHRNLLSFSPELWPSEIHCEALCPRSYDERKGRRSLLL